MTLVKFLIEEGWLKTDWLIKAFRKIKREDFLAPSGVEGITCSGTCSGSVPD